MTHLLSYPPWDTEGKKKKNSSLKSACSVCERDSFANLKHMCWRGRDLWKFSRDGDIDRWPLHILCWHRQVSWREHPPAALLRWTGARGHGTIPLPCWSQRAQVAAVPASSLAGAGMREWSWHSSTPSLTSARARRQHTFPLHCWNWRMCTVQAFFCHLSEASEGALLPTLSSCLANGSRCV